MEDQRPPATMIRDLPQADRPRERLRDAGAASLSNAELLAILLRVGSARENVVAQAQRLLGTFGGVTGFYRATFAELCNEAGLGPAKAAQIKAALELGVRLSAEGGRDTRVRVNSPDVLAQRMLAEMSLFDQEHVRTVLLDTRNSIIAETEVYVGSVHTTQVRLAELLSPAVRAKAPAMVLVHNHPSGDPTPSAPDIQMTKQLFDAGKLMDVELLDHLIIGGGRYVSMKAMRCGFPADSPR